MEILLTGNTQFITAPWVKAAFPEDHVLVTRPAGSPAGDKRLHTVELEDNVLVQQLNETYEFERIVYFSEQLTPHTEDSGGLDRLRRLLQSCLDSPIQMLYLSPPECGSTAQTGKALLAEAAEQLCIHYAKTSRLQVKILRTPYLYVSDPPEANRYFGHLFEQMEENVLRFDEKPEQQALFLCMEDLAELLGRIFDSWMSDCEILRVPDVFGTSYAQLGEKLQQLKPSQSVRYGEDALYVIPADDHVLRTRFAWFPRFKLLDDLPAMYAAWKTAQTKKQGFFRRLWEKIRLRSRLWVAAETLAAWAITEVLVRMTNSSTQFSVVDFRLLFIVLIATIHGLNAGLFAAALASLSLALSYYQQGASFVLMFYEPSNWLAFIAYFVVGAVCGYVQLRNTEAIRFVREESKNLRERLHFVRQLYQDTLEEKRSFRRQILGRQDSFGKIYSVTRQLDVMQPQELFAKTVQVMEELLQNHSLMIYRMDSRSRFARLAAESPELGTRAARSLDLGSYAPLLEAVDQGQIWVNRTLLPELPMFACGIRKDGRLVVLIFLQAAEGEQLSLYFQNLFRILCGLVETSLLRAFEYENATHDTNYFPNSNVLRTKPFVERLRAANTMQEGKMASHLLLRITTEFPTREELFAALEGAIRESDTAGLAADGNVCLLMNQAGEAEYPIIHQRLEKKGLQTERISADEESKMLLSAQSKEARA